MGEDGRYLCKDCKRKFNVTVGTIIVDTKLPLSKWFIEVFWAHFKRVIFSTYHMVSKDYLQRYINEQTYRWNTRDSKASERFADMFCKACKPFDYADVLSLSSVVNLADWKRRRQSYNDIYAAFNVA
jgi:hypothetical protein